MWKYRWLVISSLSLNLYLNPLVYHRNIFGSSSKVFGNLRTSSKIIGNCRKMFGNIRLAIGTILENLRKYSESGRKSSENHKKRRHQSVNIIKRTLHVSFCGLVLRTISHSFAALTREILFLPLEYKIHIFSPPCNILYILFSFFKNAFGKRSMSDDKTISFKKAARRDRYNHGSAQVSKILLRYKINLLYKHQ